MSATTDELRYPLDLFVTVDEEALDAAIEERRALSEDLYARSVRLQQEAAALQRLKASLEWLSALLKDSDA